VPIIDSAGHFIGAVGICGGTPDQVVDIAIAGANAVGSTHTAETLPSKRCMRDSCCLATEIFSRALNEGTARLILYFLEYVIAEMQPNVRLYLGRHCRSCR
jgi:hypothetical protein